MPGLSIKMRIIVLGITLLLQANLQAALNPLLSQSYHLNQISPDNNITLTGINPSSTFYLPKPDDWKIDFIELELIIKPSPLLLENSSLTIMVQNTPISSIQLKKAQRKTHWRIKIPVNESMEKVIPVQLIGYMMISDDVCQDLENRANWVIVSDQSLVTYRYSPLPIKTGLSNVIQMLANNNHPSANEISLIIPEKDDPQSIAPGLIIVNRITKQASWRGVKWHLVRSDWNNSALRQFNQILVASPKDLDFTQLTIKSPWKLNNNQWVNQEGKPIPDDIGLLLMTAAPQNPHKVRLIVTGNTHQALMNAAKQLKPSILNALPRQSRTLIVSHANKKNARAKRKSYQKTFEDYGFIDQIITGEGSQEINYQFKLKQGYYAPVQLQLNYANSPFVKTNESSNLTVLLNGVPVSGIFLKPDNSRKNTLNVDLPLDKLRLGMNTLTIQFNLNLNIEGCSRYNPSQAWGIVYKSSRLKFTHNNQFFEQKLNQFGSALAGDLILRLPGQEKFYRDKKTLPQLIKFITQLNSSEITKIDFKDAPPPEKGNYLYIGKPTKSILPLLSNYTQHLLKEKSNREDIDIKEMISSLTQGDKRSLIFLTHSPEKQRPHSTMLIMGTSTDSINTSLGLLSNKKKLSLITGDGAIVYDNGTFNSLNSNHRDDLKGMPTKKKDETYKIFITIIQYGTLLLLVILLASMILKWLIRNK